MRDEQAAPRARSPLVPSGLCALAGAAVLAIPVSLGDGLGASDPWRHIRWAQLLREGQPGALREWPVFTVLHDSGADLWWLFHRLLVPFTLGDLETGARLAAIAFSALGLFAFAYALGRLAPSRLPWLFFATLAFTPMLFYRALTARPSLIAMGLFALGAWAAAERRAFPALAVAFAHAWLHVSGPLQLIPAAAACCAALLAGRAVPVRVLGASAAGVAIGVLARPHPFEYLRVALVQGTAPFRMAGTAFPDLGPEIYPPTPGLLFDAAPMLAMGAACVLLGVRAWRRGKRDPLELALGLTALASLALALKSRRFLELVGPTVALYAARGLHLDSLAFAARRWARAAAAGLVALGLAANVADGIVSMEYPFRSQRLARAAQILSVSVPPGTVIFHDDWRAWAKLFFHDPTHRYLLGADPSLMLARDARRFWLWYHLGFEGLACDAPSSAPDACARGDPPPEVLAKAFAEFGAAAVVLSDTEERPRLARMLDRAPARFPPLYRGEGVDSGVVVYGVRADAGP